MPTNQHSNIHIPHVSSDFKTCTYVFIKLDAVCQSLQVSYDDPYHVVKCSDKHYIVQVNRQVISHDWLKPAYLDNANANYTKSKPSPTSIAPPHQPFLPPTSFPSIPARAPSKAFLVTLSTTGTTHSGCCIECIHLPDRINL